MDFNLIGLIRAAVLNGTPLLFGTSGEILTEKSGNMNLGVEGLMFMGGAFGLCGAFVYGRIAGDSAVGAVAVIIALLASFAAGVIGSLIFSFLTITLRANQNVTGLALTIFGTGVGQFVGELMRLKVGGNVTVSNALKDAFANPIFPEFLQKIPVLGPILFSYNFFVYLGFAIAIAMAYFMNKTRSGLSLCAVGDGYRRRDFRSGRNGLHDDDCRQCVEPQRTIRRRMGCGSTRNLLPVETAECALGFDFVWRTFDSLPSSSDSVPANADLQGRTVHSNGNRTDYRFHETEKRGPAPSALRLELLP